MKKIYISHPLRGNTDRTYPNYKIVFDNVAAVDRICQSIAATYPDVLPLSPIHAFSFLKVFEDDEKALEICLKLLELADGMWVFGDWKNSEGCRIEMRRARELCMPICYGKGGIK
jgi:hypothetical protein